MASSVGPIGYGLPRPNSVTPFSGNPSQDFDKFREQIQQSTYFSYFNLLNPDAQPTLDKLLQEATTLHARNDKEETAKNTASITHRETKAKNMLQEDAILFNLLSTSVKGEAKDIMLKAKAFVLNDKPQLHGSEAFQNLVKEYGKKKQCVADKFSAKQEVLSHFITPNLLSSQLDVHLMTLAEEHILKFTYDAPTANDFYIEALVTLVTHLPSNPTFLEVHLKMRKELTPNHPRAKEYFTATAKDIQEKFKTLQDIQKVESASKATSFVKKVERADGGKQENCHNFEQGRPCAKNPCPYKHPKLIKGKGTDKTPKTVIVKGKTAVVEESVASSQIKQISYVCSLSSQAMSSQNICLDTGATATMSSDKKSFTNLKAYKAPIRVANSQIIYSSFKGNFNLNVALNTGKEIKLLFPESLYVPTLSGTLISDQSLTKLHFKIILDEHGMIMKRNNEQVDLLRLPNGVITFPTTNTALISNVQQQPSLPKVNTLSTSQTTVPAPRKSITTVPVPVESISQTTVHANRKTTVPVPVPVNIETPKTTVATTAPGKCSRSRCGCHLNTQSDWVMIFIEKIHDEQ